MRIGALREAAAQHANEVAEEVSQNYAARADLLARQQIAQAKLSKIVNVLSKRVMLEMVDWLSEEPAAVRFHDTAEQLPNDEVLHPHQPGGGKTCLSVEVSMGRTDDLGRFKILNLGDIREAEGDANPVRVVRIAAFSELSRHLDHGGDKSRRTNISEEQYGFTPSVSSLLEMPISLPPTEGQYEKIVTLEAQVSAQLQELPGTLATLGRLR